LDVPVPMFSRMTNEHNEIVCHSMWEIKISLAFNMYKDIEMYTFQITHKKYKKS